MKRCTYLFLAVSLFVCYGGLCRDALASIKPVSGKANPGCHSMSHGGEKAESAGIGQKIVNPAASISSCCYDSLLNAPVDYSAAVGQILVQIITIENLNSNAYYSIMAQDRSLREHDPPDLQISNSVFLL